MKSGKILLCIFQVQSGLKFQTVFMRDFFFFIVIIKVKTVPIMFIFLIKSVSSVKTYPINVILKQTLRN